VKHIQTPPEIQAAPGFLVLTNVEPKDPGSVTRDAVPRPEAVRISFEQQIFDARSSEAMNRDLMNGDTTPGQTGSIPCPHCRSVIFFLFKGGPQQLTCPACRKIVSLEVVHDGIKWRTQLRPATK
jgi:hypothetical protein